MMKDSRSQGNLRNPCLTMHQPWASLLIYGIKRIEGRSWPAPIRGRLWIHAAGKVPDEATIKAMEDFYREIYAVNGVTDLKFPEHYPVSRLLGCVEIVGCLRKEELASWDTVPEGVRLEAQTDYCWLCERPQRLIIPFEMRGYQRVYNLENKIYEAAVRGLCTVQCPLPVNFLLPNPKDPFSLKPGCLSSQLQNNSKSVELEKSATLSVAIQGARDAATQFSKKDQRIQNRTITRQIESTCTLDEASVADTTSSSSSTSTNSKQQSIPSHENPMNSRRSRTEVKQQGTAGSKMFAAAVRDLRLS